MVTLTILLVLNVMIAGFVFGGMLASNYHIFWACLGCVFWPITIFIYLFRKIAKAVNELDDEEPTK